MKNIFLLLLLISGASFSQSKDCSRLKNCKLQSLVVEDTSYIVIKNNEYSQIYDDGSFIKSKINWISNCEAEIIISEVSIPDFPLAIGEKLKLKVDKITGDVAEFSVTMQGETYNSKFKIIK